ncbi:MAG: amidase [Anaerolineae bacterium CG_4_9_14_3_um_filter_57_17]|nr:amidase [bacterium]NCT20359.1 amidase [bacterium]PJB67011.1 MAG: amidase [Anaerolineae bacterium CG_4_9_14_3_um_filter_57_17]
MQELSIPELQAQMSAGQLTARQLTESYLERIRQLDGLTRAVVEINPDALPLADSLDAERAAGNLRGPLHGIPILLKENIDTGDKMQTTAGSLALAGHLAGRDAFLVEKLRAAGALIFGKTNLSEWANFRSTHSSSGWSSRGGQTRNPYALDRTPCGSSSGSAVAVAANFCAAAIGTETDGSITCPAGINGIVGLKPSLGLISRSGIIPLAHSQDTAGPMTRTVTEAAILLGALAAPDSADPATAAICAGVDYSASLNPAALIGARIGVCRNFLGADARAAQVFERALEILRALGAEVVDPANLANESKYAKSELEVLLYEFRADLNAYLAAHPAAPRRSLAEITAYNEKEREKIMPFFGQERMLQAEKKRGLKSPRYAWALEQARRLSREGIDALMAAQRLDALIAPTNPAAWMIDPVHGDQFPGGGFSSAAAVAGYPHITVPMGFLFGLPLGLSFFGAAWTEAKLLGYAYAFEQAAQVRQSPRFLPTVMFS